LNKILFLPFSRTSLGKIPYQTLTMTASYSQINDFYISTNAVSRRGKSYIKTTFNLIFKRFKGQIIHISRKGNSFTSSLLKSDISGSDEMLYVNYVAFHPEITDVLLAGYGNGEIRFYHKDYSKITFFPISLLFHH